MSLVLLLINHCCICSWFLVNLIIRKTPWPHWAGWVFGSQGQEPAQTTVDFQICQARKWVIKGELSWRWNRCRKWILLAKDDGGIKTCSWFCYERNVVEVAFIVEQNLVVSLVGYLPRPLLHCSCPPLPSPFGPCYINFTINSSSTAIKNTHSYSHSQKFLWTFWSGEWGI